jgi:magnesium chelatase accessory protein
MTRPDFDVEGADWPNRASSRFVEAGGLRWHVQAMGEGPVLLLLHGTAAATHSWRGLAPLLARHFTVIAPDLPGHGFTDTPDAMSLPGLAALAGQLVEALGQPPQMVVGHSAGAAIAVRAALDGHIAPRAIVGIGAALLPFPGALAMLFPAMARMLFANPFVPHLFAMRVRVPGEVERFLARSTGSTIDAEGLAHYERLFRSPAHVGGALAMMAGWDLIPLERDLPRLRVPLALIHGTRDKTVPPSVSERVAKLVPTAELFPIPGLGHLAHEEQPGRIADILMALAARHGIASSEGAK